MLQIYKSADSGIITLDQVENGAWINLINPDQQEILCISNNLNISVDHIKAALDEEERSRIEVDEGCTIVLIDIPVPKSDQKDGGIYYTIPLRIIITEHHIVTVSLKENYIIRDFIEKKIKHFIPTKKCVFCCRSFIRLQNCTFSISEILIRQAIGLNVNCINR